LWLLNLIFNFFFWWMEICEDFGLRQRYSFTLTFTLLRVLGYNAMEFEMLVDFSQNYVASYYRRQNSSSPLWESQIQHRLFVSLSYMILSVVQDSGSVKDFEVRHG
jgi:hypothetical protein